MEDSSTKVAFRSDPRFCAYDRGASDIVRLFRRDDLRKRGNSVRASFVPQIRPFSSPSEQNINNPSSNCKVTQLSIQVHAKQSKRCGLEE